MSPSRPAVVDGPPRSPGPARTEYRAAQMRVVSAALGLFAERGVSGTSLQMIANAMGVTKAAVYFQFKTKEEIVLAVADVELAALDAAIEAAEAEGRSVRAREVLLAQVIDLAIERRRIVGLLQSDPVMVRFLAEHEPFRRVIDRLFAVLLGEDPSQEAWVQAAMLSGAIGGAVAHPRTAALDDDTLRSHLLPIARRLFDLPDPR